MHILGAIAEFERGRIAERVKVGMQRAKSAGRHVGRRRRDVSDEEIAAVAGMSLRRAANALGVSKSFSAHVAPVQKGGLKGSQFWPESSRF